jgi:hypothetical protein
LGITGSGTIPFRGYSTTRPVPTIYEIIIIDAEVLVDISGDSHDDSNYYNAIVS